MVAHSRLHMKNTCQRNAEDSFSCRKKFLPRGLAEALNREVWLWRCCRPVLGPRHGFLSPPWLVKGGDEKDSEAEGLKGPKEAPSLPSSSQSPLR